MADLGDVLDLDATAQAALVRSRQLSPVELVEAAVRRAESANPALNAIVTPLYEQAVSAARGALPEGPFTGVPFLVKDLIASVAGARKTEGSRFLAGHVAKEDSELVRRYRRAGLVILGITNASEFGLLPTTEPAFHGPTRNPWNHAHSPGGSSGGSAAAVAARITPMAHANDWGGSIRIPASCCGLFGMKPTRARNPLGPRYGDMLSGLVQEHAVTRSVRDSAALLDATAGPGVGDPYAAPPPRRPYLEEVGAASRKLRIALWTEPVGGGEVHPDCLSAVRAAARLCEELGHTVEEAALPISNWNEMVSAFVTVYAAGTAALMSDWAAVVGKAPTPDGFEPLTWALAEIGRARSSGDYLGAVAELQRSAREAARLFETYDVVLSPTLAEPPVLLGTFDAPKDMPLLGFMRAGGYVPFLTVGNITGNPSMSVPLAWNDAGLPIGSLFMGRFGDEGTLFGLAAELERARPWQPRVPGAPVSRQ
jgi:amidase